MRGTHGNTGVNGHRIGIIPAYAGNTDEVDGARFRLGDHPRVCGEHDAETFSGLACLGSSPRMRGTRRRNVFRSGVPGIIPAYAGNTSCARCDWSAKAHHPRVCGEHRSKPCSVRFVMGSSPRMRGTQCRLAMNNGPTGIIPAYAGNTIVSKCDKITERDHPRVCGEHTTEPACGRWSTGSSPRMRGTPKWMVLHVLPYGIIPAYAGNTPAQERPTSLQRDHPRVCGEHVVERRSRRGFKGSSPRMRGTLAICRNTIATTGIIPAYAGNTR